MTKEGKVFHNSKKMLMTSASMCVLSALASAQAAAQQNQSQADDEDFVFEEIIVTARFRSESLQEVPDSITAFSASKIEKLGITDIEGVVNQTPNFIVRETFRAGVTFITIRGITTGQQGFAPITYTVDGVKAATLDAINQGALFDIERIEVLKGPQGALYGAGAIAGAVNVVTKKPSNEFEGQLIGSYGTGNDLTLKGAVSGPIVKDKLAFRLTGFYRNTDGLIDSTAGEDLDFEEQYSVKGRLLFTPSEVVSVDLRAAYTDIEAGAAFQERFGDLADLNNFDLPGPARGIVGVENREFVDLSAKIDIDFGGVTLTSVNGYLDLNQDLFGSVSFDEPPGAGEVPGSGLLGPILGVNAGPGEPIDQFQDLADNFEVFTSDTRLTSTGDGPLRWVIGAEYINRKTINQLQIGLVLGPPPGTDFNIPFRFDDKEDDIFGIYAQVNYDLTDKLELTVAGRYDQNRFSTRQFDPATGNTINQVDENGNATIAVLREKNKDFQPKAQLSYQANDDVLLYATYAEGFRFGFFNTGNLTLPEKTNNYELGFKSTLADGRLTFNGALFHIDYSDQQVTSVIPTPPFRITNNIPSADINGVELEFNWSMDDNWTVNGGIGYLDSEINQLEIALDAVPKWTTNLGIEYAVNVTGDYDFVLRGDWRYQDNFILTRSPDTFQIDGIHLINVRAGIEGETWALRAFVNNLADEQFATDVSNLGPGFIIRSFSKPRAYGVELSYRF